MSNSKLLNEVLKELDKAVNKFPLYPNDALHALAILGEEYGELNKAVLQYTYEPHKTSLDEIKSEAIQTCAMALRFLISLEDNYLTFNECTQHKQRLNKHI